MAGLTKLKLIEIANRIPLFKALSGHEKEQVVSIPKIVKAFKAGERFITFGEHNDSFYIILSGKAGVYKKKTRLALLEGGQFVGEVGIICDEPRTANVIAETDLITFKVDRTKFNQFPMLLRDKVKDKLIAGLIGRIEKMNSDLVHLKSEIAVLEPQVEEENIELSEDACDKGVTTHSTVKKANVSNFKETDANTSNKSNVESVDEEGEIEQGDLQQERKDKVTAETEGGEGSPWCPK